MIKKLVIIGRDADAWLSALLLQLRLSNSGSDIKIQLVELPSRLGSADFFVSIPSLRAFHQLLGLSETKILDVSEGIFTLAQRFSGWSTNSSAFMHAYDTQGIPFDHVEFFQYWIKAQKKGLNVPLEEFSFGAVAAKQGKYIQLNENTEAFSKATYGYHLNAWSYLKALGQLAIKAGLDHVVGDLASIKVENGIIRSCVLQDGKEIVADLFIDATGSEGLLIDELRADNFENWSSWFPCDRILTATAPALSPVPAFSQSTAFSEGWVGLYPLLNRTGVKAVYSSKYIDGESLPDRIKKASGVNIRDASVSDLKVGARNSPWQGNCVAIGSAAINLDPIDGLDLHALQISLTYLLTLLPNKKIYSGEADLYNKKLRNYAANMRDFQISHYKLNTRVGEPLWDTLRSMSVPSTLQEKIDLFKCRGVIAMRENETFQEENWTSIFSGHGLMPESYDPLVDRMPEQLQIGQFQKILKFIAAEVVELPSLQAHLDFYSEVSTSTSGF